MSTTFRLPLVIRIGNTVMNLLLKRGARIGTNTLLTVPGRKSGVPRTTPVTIIEYQGRRYIQSPFGAVDWVRNLRAAGSATLSRGRHTETVAAVELSPEQAGPVLKSAFRLAPAMIRSYYDVTADSSLDEFVREALRHPTFELIAVPKPSGASSALVQDQNRQLEICGERADVGPRSS
jgi:deazaflavin-dependent oxidoreductase (nitroreductase family)